jgi:hypothetical protein
MQFELVRFRKSKTFNGSAARIQPVVKSANTSVLEECYILMASEEVRLEVNIENIKYKFIARLQVQRNIAIHRKCGEV